jgi:Flp pilus assembly protein TadD
MDHAEAAAATAAAHARPVDEVLAREVLARLLLDQGRPGAALAASAAALTLAEAIDARPLIWRVRAGRAAALAQLGHGDEAATEYRTAAGAIRTLADTIPDAALRLGYLADPTVAAVLARAESATGGV